MNIQVYITDEHYDLSYNRMRLHFIDAAIWATRYCASYRRFDIQDVSDASLVCDQIAMYEFADEKEALMFRLKWS